MHKPDSMSHEIQFLLWTRSSETLYRAMPISVVRVYLKSEWTPLCRDTAPKFVIINKGLHGEQQTKEATPGRWSSRTNLTSLSVVKSKCQEGHPRDFFSLNPRVFKMRMRNRNRDQTTYYDRRCRSHIRIYEYGAHGLLAFQNAARIYPSYHFRIVVPKLFHPADRQAEFSSSADPHGTFSVPFQGKIFGEDLFSSEFHLKIQIPPSTPTPFASPLFWRAPQSILP